MSNQTTKRYLCAAQQRAYQAKQAKTVKTPVTIVCVVGPCEGCGQSTDYSWTADRGRIRCRCERCLWSD